MNSSGPRNPSSHICIGELKYTVVRSICITSSGTLGFRGPPVEKHCFRALSLVTFVKLQYLVEYFIPKYKAKNFNITERSKVLGAQCKTLLLYHSANSVTGSQTLISKFDTKENNTDIKENNTDIIFTNFYSIRNAAFHKHYSQHPTIQLTYHIFQKCLYTHKMVLYYSLLPYLTNYFRISYHATKKCMRLHGQCMTQVRDGT